MQHVIVKQLDAYMLCCVQESLQAVALVARAIQATQKAQAGIDATLAALQSLQVYPRTR